MKAFAVLFRAIAFFAVAMASIVVAHAQVPAHSVLGNDTICQIFLYSPGEKEGLHLAWLDEAGTWQHAGQLCGSDYAQWGAGKRMYHPSVVHASDGSWRLVFSVDDTSPCFAAAYSEDLLTWRPQDYPRMSAQGCLAPIAFEMDDGSFDIYYKDKKGGKHYVQASADFRSFIEDMIPSAIDDVAWLRDTVIVAERQQGGYIFEVPKLHLDYIRYWYRAMEEEDRRNAETMRDDSVRFASLPERIEARMEVEQGAGKPISDKLIGVFFEDISYAADGGLYAELVQNRDFEYSARDRREWDALTAWKTTGNVEVSTEDPLSANNPHHAVLQQATIANQGWDGIALKRGASYDFSVYARASRAKQKLRVQLVADGVVLARKDLAVKAEGWHQLSAVLIPKADALNAELQVSSLDKGGTVAVDMVSLFPRDTYQGHGLRRDLAEAIANLKPKFVRFPGGCMTHGQGLDNIYHWQHSVGSWQDRKPDFNIWHYHQTRGLGFYEYFQFCEDIGAEPLPVLAAGVPCQNSAPDATGYGGQQGGIPMADMPAYIDEICSLIEWANGDPSVSKWARMRADAGHPAPFGLKYIGIGNEDLVSTAFEERCEMICRTIRQRYPDIIICGTVGPFHDPSADYIEGWRFARQHKDIIDMVDEHYYESPGWFVNHTDYYDDYDREGPKVYVGEYASRSRTHESALAEALFLCNIERNADAVAMTSYAPLLAKDGHHNWNPDLIYFDNTSVRLTPSYYTQHLFGRHAGDRYVSSQITVGGLLFAADSLHLADGNNGDLAQGLCSSRIAASVVRDTASGKTFLKIVNALPRPLSISVAGLSLSPDALVTAFTGRPADEQVTTYSSADASAASVDSPVRVAGQTVQLAPYTVCAVTL